MLLKENSLVENLSEIADLTFTQIEVKVKPSLTAFCLEVSQIDQKCFEEGTDYQPGILPSLWALWDLNGNQKIEATELASGQK